MARLAPGEEHRIAVATRGLEPGVGALVTQVSADEHDPDHADNSTGVAVTAVRRPVTAADEATPKYTIPSWADGLWDQAKNYSTITSGDITGDGRAELIGRSPFGIVAYTFDTDLGQWTPLYQGSQLGLADSQNWSQPQYYSTIQLANVDGMKGDELIARGAAGVNAWRYDVTARTWSALSSIPDFTDPSWAVPQYYSTIQAADLNADGKAEVFGRSASGIDIWSFDGTAWTAFPTDPVLDAYADVHGWNQPQYYRTIQTADIDGDKKPEILLRGSAGIGAITFSGGSWANVPSTNAYFTDAEGYDRPECYLTLQTGDLNGDGRADVFGRCDDGLTAVTYENGAWQGLAGSQFPFQGSSWNAPQYYETIQAADINGDGAAEVIGRGGADLTVWSLGSDGQWASLPGIGSLSDVNGWDLPQYYETIQTVRAYGGAKTDPTLLIARGATGVQSFRYDATTSSWDSPSAEFPKYVTGGAKRAYDAINAVLADPTQPGWDLRTQYGTSTSGQLQGRGSWPQKMNQMPQPANVPGPIWAAVKAQLNREMTAVRFIENWFGQTGYMHSYADDLFLLKTMDDTAARLVFEKQRQNEVSMAAWEMVQGMLEAFSLPEIKGFKALGEALESVGERMAAGTSASLEFGLIQEMDEIRGAYGHIQDELQNSFVDSTSGFGDIKQASAVDYGQLMALGQMASGWSQLTSDDEDHAQAAALRQYDLSVWQTLTQALWILQDYPDASGCASRSQSGDSVPCDLVDGVHHYILVSQEYGNPTISDEFREQLWEAPEEDCLTSWNASCALDQTRAEVVFAYNGWPKLLYQRCKISESGAAWECTDTNR